MRRLTPTGVGKLLAGTVAPSSPPRLTVAEALKVFSERLRASGSAGDDEDIVRDVKHLAGVQDAEQHKSPTARSARQQDAAAAAAGVTVDSLYSVALTDLVSKVVRRSTPPAALDDADDVPAGDDDDDNDDDDGWGGGGGHGADLGSVPVPDLQSSTLRECLAWAQPQVEHVKALERAERERAESAEAEAGTTEEVAPVPPPLPSVPASPATPAAPRPASPTDAGPAPRSFAARLADCWRGRRGIQKENALLVRALREGRAPVPEGVLDPSTGLVFVVPVWDSSGRVVERPAPRVRSDGEGEDDCGDVVHHALASEVCAWKLRSFLMFRPADPGATSRRPSSGGRSAERSVLSWQRRLPGQRWESYASDDAHAIEAEFQVGQSGPKQVVTADGLCTFSFEEMQATAKAGGGTSVTTELRRLFFLPTQTFADMKLYWRRVRQLMHERAAAAERARLFQGGVDFDSEALRRMGGGDREQFADRQHVVLREAQARRRVAAGERQDRVEVGAARLAQVEEARRFDVAQQERKIRLILWTIAEQHSAAQRAREQREGAAQLRRRAWEIRFAQQQNVVRREGRRARRGQEVSEYSRACFTDRFLMMLETQQQRKDGTLRRGPAPRAEAVEVAEPPCPHCPDMETHMESHWMWVGAPRPSVPQRASRICLATHTTGLQIVPERARILPVRQPYLY